MRPLCLQPAEPRSGYARDPPEERAVELARILSVRRYLDGGADTEDVATLLVEAAGTLSIQTPVRGLIYFTTRVLSSEVEGRLQTKNL